VTASLPVAAILAPRATYTVLLLGGLVRARTMATVEHWAINMLSDFVIDLAFIGSNGIALEHGLTTPDPRVAAVKKAVVEASHRTIFVGGSEKFGQSSFCRFADISDLELIVTDHRLPASVAQRYLAAGTPLVRA
jgi:DeoR/GlpR family transcriptional regulator of sugar metabolism